MANNLNRCDFIGHIGNDADIRYTQSGLCVASMQIAIGGFRKTKEGDGYENTTTWVNLRAFGKTGERLGSHKKGELVRVSCVYRSEQYTDKEGNQRYAHYFIVNDFEPLTFTARTEANKKVVEHSQNVVPKTELNQPDQTIDFDDEIPF